MGALDSVFKKQRCTEVSTVNLNSNNSLEQPGKDTESQLLNTDGCVSRSRIKWVLAVDLPLYVAAITLIVLFEKDVIPQRKSGFFCNDPALSFPFTGDSVSNTVILSTLLILPLVIVFLCELLVFDSRYSKRGRLDHGFRKTLSVYRSYNVGLLLNIAVVEVMKGIVGSPRPMFFDVCEPDAALTCKGSEYVADFQCTSTRYQSWWQTDSSRSFPSGHTSTSVFCGFFLSWYLQKRVFSWRNRTVLLVPMLQFLCISYSAICSLTRITDHRHHWWDVLVGAVIGFLSMLFTVTALCNNFESNKKWSERSIMSASQQTVHTYDGRT